MEGKERKDESRKREREREKIIDKMNDLREEKREGKNGREGHSNKYIYIYIYIYTHLYLYIYYINTAILSLQIRRRQTKVCLLACLLNSQAWKRGTTIRLRTNRTIAYYCYYCVKSKQKKKKKKRIDTPPFPVPLSVSRVFVH